MDGGMPPSGMPPSGNADFAGAKICQANSYGAQPFFACKQAPDMD
jgi:hypothetical protein